MALSTLSGVVFEDANQNRIQDGEEAGIAGVTVYLDADDNGVFDAGETSVVSDVTGNYAFEGLAAGDYVIRQVTPPNFQQTAPQGGPGRLFATTSFGTHRVQELDPANGNILNEFPLPNPQSNFTQGLAFDGATLFHYENNAKILYELNPDTGAVIDSTSLSSQFANRNIGGLAAMNGLVYLLDSTSVTAAPALVVFDPVADAVVSEYPRLSGVTVERGLAELPGENLLVTSSADSEFLFLDPANGEIQATVPYEATLSNTTVSGLASVEGQIYLTAGGRITDVLTRDGVLVRSFINPSESGGLAGGPGGDGAHRVSLDGEADVGGLDFGNRSTVGRITGVKFEDLDGDGVRGAGEGGLAGVTIYLDQNRNGVLDDGEASTTTAPDGSYAFEDLAPATYVVREVVPPGFVQTGPIAEDPYYLATTRPLPSAPRRLVRIDAATGAVTTIGELQIAQTLHGLVRTNDGRLFANTGQGSDDAFYAVDPETGAATLIGPTGRHVAFGLAYDPITDTIYGVGQVTTGRRGLLTYDRNTGLATPVGVFTDPEPSNTNGIAFDPERNRIYVYNFANGFIYAFDADTGAGSGVVADAPDRLGGNLAFVDGQLVMKRDFGGPRNEFLTIDPDTGEAASLFFASEGFVAESLEYVAPPKFAHEVTVAAGQTSEGADFGNQRRNLQPTADAGGPYEVREGVSVSLDASGSTDPDGDALTYAWDLNGDGQFDDAVGATVSVSWEELTALGLGDDGEYPISVEVSDGELSDSVSGTLTVENTAPAITSLAISAANVGAAAPGQIVSLSAAFADPGALDTHTAVIDWGDGETSPGAISAGGVTGSHPYAEAGVYFVSVSVTDDDDGADSQSATAYVTGVRVAGGVLQIVGTAGGDKVSITSHRKHGSEVRGSLVSGRGVSFDPSQVNSIEAYLGDGNDQFSVDASFSQPLLVVGGAGKDRIASGGGRSLVIGGTGADRLNGGGAQDLLIAGATAFDHNVAALRALLAEWSSERTLQQRAANLFDGSGAVDRENADYFLTVGEQGTVFDDNDRDTLDGGGSIDWLFYDPDRDRTRGKARDDLFANDLDELFGEG